MNHNKDFEEIGKRKIKRKVRRKGCLSSFSRANAFPDD